MVAKKSGGSASKGASKPSVKKTTVKDLSISRQKGGKVKGGGEGGTCGQSQSCGVTMYTCINCSTAPVCNP